MADAFPIADRGVYAEPFTVKGRRGYYAVDSHGEQVAYRTVRAGVDPAEAIAELWVDLNILDPIQAHLREPYLGLVR